MKRTVCLRVGTRLSPRISQIKTNYANVPWWLPTLTLTAAATDRVRQDIIQQLALAKPNITFVASILLLYYEVQPETEAKVTASYHNSINKQQVQALFVHSAAAK